MISLLETDKKYLWHPYTQHGLNEDILAVESAKGAYLELKGGRRLLDAISSWWVNLHGHGNSELAQAAKTQIETLDHVIFAGFTHEPAALLAEKLLKGAQQAGSHVGKVFYSDNGSTAVEVALKMAYQYHLQSSGAVRPRFLALRSAYHGDTFGAMAVGEPNGFHEIFRPLLPRVDFVEPEDIGALKDLLLANKNEYAAFIIEPLVQGAGGMRMHSTTYLKQVETLCKENGILLICDEVFTGFYRTGALFSFSHAKVKPDMICVSKGITGGVLPLAATLVTRGIYNSFVSEKISQAFLHGHSYTANPVSCSVALASWTLLHSTETQKNIADICRATLEEMQGFADNKFVVDPRVLGTIGAVTMTFDFNYMSNASRWFKVRALEKGVLLRPLGHVLYAVPPYCTTREEIKKIYTTISELIYEYGKL